MKKLGITNNNVVVSVKIGHKQSNIRQHSNLALYRWLDWRYMFADLDNSRFYRITGFSN